ncbi:hypothetical protein [Candidatus Rhabdochlamydia sp. T3358]|uniref:hypothetical protein n=1 Tax=Candidatus Rhabdochlamydia sp. T3358 TaxID=2099795 RepID=UPI0010B98A3D|nr:hypothetical protein [Candidatus Rhabdochlamydia sp. T3358]VHO00867.1 hypothetical protein RHT_00208 [Candidatus Rhabdochlamydia sp. T3358]
MNAFSMGLFIFILSFLSIHSMHCSEIDLGLYEKSVHSQNGEDGVTEALFDLIGSDSKFFVEFGVQDGSECNTRYLREHLGWSGLMMDSDHQNTAINLQQERITAENINSLFEKYQVPDELDLLSIDIDSNDFHIWHAIDSRYRPKVVIIEYNATHLPHEDKVVVYDPNLCWDGYNYFGASILSLYKLARKKGYSLVYADNTGVNLFFIRDDLVEMSSFTFKNINCVDKTYKYFGHNGSGPNKGHQADPYKRPYVMAEQLLL